MHCRPPKHRLQALLLLLLLGSTAYGQKKKAALPEKAFMAQFTTAFQTARAQDYLQLLPLPKVLDALQPVLPRVFIHSGTDAAEVAADGFRLALERATVRRFQQVVEAGKEMGLHWSHLRLARYQLVRQAKTRDTVLEALAPERYHGYVFLFDPMLQKTFGLRIPDLVAYEGQLYGDAPLRVFPAETVPEYERHAEAAARAEAKGKKYIAFTPPLPEEPVDSAEAEDPLPAPKGVVAERRFYTGTFDKEKPVELFIRGYRGECVEGICRWNAVMRVGDEDWVPLTLKKKDGLWMLTELPDVAVMELKPEGDALTGTWTAADDDTGYEVKLTETKPTRRELSRMDEALDDFRL